MTRKKLIPAAALILLAVAFAQSGCSSVGYNPYIQNGGHRPIGKTIEGTAETANDALSGFDMAFETAYY